MAQGETEALQAAEWFGSQLLPDQPDLRAAFSARLRELLVERNRGHWYVDEPHRGCGYRALMCTTNACDPTLVQAAEGVGIKDLLSNFCKQFGDVGEVICWLNPGEVKVLLGKSQKMIYSDGTGSDNPYEKLRIKIKPTRLNVKVDTSHDDREMNAPGSPASSAGGPSCGGSEGFGYRFQGQSSQGGMGSSGTVTPRDIVSPSESPAQSWRSAHHCPPAMAPLPPHISQAQSYGMFQQGDVGGALDGAVNMALSMGGMGGLGGDQTRPAQQQQFQPGASPMRGAAFSQMGGGGPCSSAPVIF